MQHINRKQVSPEARLVRELGFYRHLLLKASDTSRGVSWPCDPGTYHHDLNCNENNKEYEIKTGPLGAIILQISTSRLLNLME